MAGYIVFQLHGPMASWGNIAVGEYRTTWPRPSRSALLGLVAAALGVPRSDETAQTRLRDGLAFAVAVDAPGQPMRDYHTVQTPKVGKGFAPRSRSDELRSSKKGTIQSYRDYYTDVFYRVVTWTTSTDAPSALELCDGLLRPRFTLYLGRKSCPLGLPLAPCIVEASTVEEALGSASLPSPLDVLPTRARRERVFRMLDVPDRPELHWPEGGPPAGVYPQRTLERWDDPASRARWQFGSRREHVGTLADRWLGADWSGADDSADGAAAQGSEEEEA